MRPRDPRIPLSEVLRASELIASFLEGRTFEHYGQDALLSSAVERQFEIVGEALGRALRADATLEARIPDVHRIIGFRNVLAHGYDNVSNMLVWSIAQERLPQLVRAVSELLRERE